MYKGLLKRSPNNQFAHIDLTCTYSAAGREEEARQQAEELLELHPTFSLDKYEKTVSPLFQEEGELERWIDNLRKAGLKWGL